MKTFRQIKKIITATIGFIVLITGIILIVTPGPASLVIPAGLAILATEFVWARNLLNKIKSKMGRSRQSADIN